MKQRTNASWHTLLGFQQQGTLCYHLIFVLLSIINLILYIMYMSVSDSDVQCLAFRNRWMAMGMHWIGWWACSWAIFGREIADTWRKWRCVPTISDLGVRVELWRPFITRGVTNQEQKRTSDTLVRGFFFQTLMMVAKLFSEDMIWLSLQRIFRAQPRLDSQVWDWIQLAA